MDKKVNKPLQEVTLKKPSGLFCDEERVKIACSVLTLRAYHVTNRKPMIESIS